mgnify:CR=1 FL=1
MNAVYTEIVTTLSTAVIRSNESQHNKRIHINNVMVDDWIFVKEKEKWRANQWKKLNLLNLL